MKYFTSLLFLILMLGAVISCAPRAGSPEAQLLMQKKVLDKKIETVETMSDKTPKWCKNVPTSNFARYSCGTGISSNLNIAQSRALMAAKRQIADQLQGEISILTEDFTKSIGDGPMERVQQQFEIITRNVTSPTKLSGYQISKTETLSEEGNFIHYLLIEYPIGAANTALIAEIRKNEVLSTQENAEKAMAKLEAEIQKRRNR